MNAQIDVWEKDNAQSAQSFAQNLEAKIKEVELKLNKLVNAFLDGTIEKETYLKKKDELIKTKTDLLQKKSDFGRKGNNWIEPLRDWIKTAHHAEKLASSKDFYEIKIFVEKIGTNRRLLDKKVFLDFEKPFDLIPYSKSSYNKEILAKKKSKNNLSFPQKSQTQFWSQLLNAVRTHFETSITNT